MSGFRSGSSPFSGANSHLEPGEDQEGAEEPDHPVELHEHRAEADEDRPEDEGSEDAVEEDAVLVLRGNREVAEDQHEDEDVVDRQRLLDDEARQELQRDLPRGRRGVESGHAAEARVVREPPQRVPVERPAEGQRETDPHRAPHGRLAEPDFVRVAMEEPEIDRQQDQHAAGEGGVQPPVVGEGEESERDWAHAFLPRRCRSAPSSSGKRKR